MNSWRANARRDENATIWILPNYERHHIRFRHAQVTRSHVKVSQRRPHEAKVSSSRLDAGRSAYACQVDARGSHLLRVRGAPSPRSHRDHQAVESHAERVYGS